MSVADEATRARAANGELSFWRRAGLEGVEILEARACPKRWRFLHEAFAFCTIQSGGAQFEYRTHDAESGTTHLLEPGNIHRDLRAAPRNDFDVVFVSAETVASTLGVAPEKLPHLRDGLSRSPRVARALQALVDDCKHTSTQLDTRSSLSELVGAIFEAHGETCGAARRARHDLRAVVRLRAVGALRSC